MYLEGNWTAEDTSALSGIFDAAWRVFTQPFYIANFQTSWWQLIVTAFAIVLVFKFVKGVADL